MPNFTAVLHTKEKGRHKKTIRASSDTEALERLRSENNFVIDLAEQKADSFTWKARFRDDKIELYRQLANTIQVGAIRPIRYREALLPIFNPKSKFYPIADGFLAACGKGPIWRAMEAYPQAFHEYEINLMQTAGEADSINTLRMMVVTLVQQSKLAKRTSKILFWPMLMTLGMLVVIYIFFTNLLPQMEQTAASIPNMTLPSPLPQLIAVQQWLSVPQHAVMAVLGLLLTILGAVAAGSTPKGKLTIDRYIMLLGEYGKIVRLSRVGQIFFLLNLMNKMGQQYTAYDFAVGAAQGPFARAAMERVRDAFHGKKYPNWPENLKEAADIIDRQTINRLILANENAMLKDELGHVVEFIHDEIDDLVERFAQKLQASLSTLYAFLAAGILYLVIVPLNGFIANLH